MMKIVDEKLPQTVHIMLRYKASWDYVTFKSVTLLLIPTPESMFLQQYFTAHSFKKC